MTVTAVVIGHRDELGIWDMVRQMKEQTKPPDEIIASVCCMDVDELVFEGDVDRLIIDRHRDDVGQRLCDYGLRLATCDYVFFASSDDRYDPTFIEMMSAHDADIIHCDFFSHLNGCVLQSAPVTGWITRGNFLVRRELAQRVGYNHRVYDGDGRFIMDLKAAGATDVRVPHVLYHHL